MRLALPAATLFLAAIACAQPDLSPVGAAPRAQPAELAQWQARFEARSFRSTSGEVLPYRIAKPSIGAPRPLVLVLHGSGAMGSDNKGQLGPFAASWAQLLDSPDAPIVVVPQVAARSADYLNCGELRCASRPGPSFPLLLQLLDSFAASREVDRQRIYVVGFSMGGSAALQLALARPQLIAGLVAFAPVPPAQDRAAELTLLPLLVVQGSKDTENSFAVTNSWMERLKAAGGRGKLSIRPGMKHQVPDDMLVDKGWRHDLLQMRLDARL